MKINNRRAFVRGVEKLTPIINSANCEASYKDLKSGNSSFLRMERVDSSSYDVTWIEKIEDCMFDIGEIVKNPRKTTEIVTSVVPVELARKTNAESVQHLASHTELIKEIDEDGNVIPKKVLNIGTDDFYQTYENKFVATLIRRLVLFVEKRYEFVFKYAPLKSSQILYMKNKSIINGQEVEIETKVKISRSIDDEGFSKNSTYLKRISDLRNSLRYYYSSEFMKKLKTERDVRSPILMTNILRKNPLYRHCYELYRFIEKYNRLGIGYKVKETYKNLDQEEIENLNKTMFFNYLATDQTELELILKNVVKSYKPKILTSLDDESFIYGPLLSGPIEFVRVDAGYQEYLKKKNKNVPLTGTKQEKEYNKEEIAAIKETRDDKRAADELLARKKKEVKEFEKRVNEILKERAKEEERLALEQALEIERKRQKEIEEARERLIREAQGQQIEEPKEEAPIAEETLAEPVKENKPAPKKKKKKVVKKVVAPIPVEEKQPEPEPEPLVEEPIKEPEPEPVVEEPIKEPEPEPVIVPAPVKKKKTAPKKKAEPKPKAKKAEPKKKPAPKPKAKKAEPKPKTKKPAPKPVVAPVPAPAPAPKPKKKVEPKKKEKYIPKKKVNKPLPKVASTPKPKEEVFVRGKTLKNKSTRKKFKKRH